MDLRTNRKEWLETNREITKLIEESKYAKLTWLTLRFLSGNESCTTGMSLLYRGRVYASHRARPQLSSKTKRISLVAKVMRTPGRRSWIPDALRHPQVPPRCSMCKRPLPSVNLGRRVLNSRMARRQVQMV